MILIRTNLLPRSADAMTVWPVVLIRPQHAADHGLLAHEAVHYAEQRGLRVVWWWLRYLLSPRFRLAAEVRAYRRQIAVRGISPAAAAHYLATGYHLDISYRQALDLLTGNPDA